MQPLRTAARTARRLVSSLPFRPRSVTLIDAPLHLGQAHAGVARGPAALRAAGLAASLRALGHDVSDAGDAGAAADAAADAADASAPPGGAAAAPPALLRHSALLSRASQRLAAAVQGALARGATPVTLGGDHSISLGSIAGVLRARSDARVLWVDARAYSSSPRRACAAAAPARKGALHLLTAPPCPTPLPHADADINTPADSASGNMHGMPLAFLTRLAAPAQAGPDWAWLAAAPPLPAAHLAYIGLRDVDPGERATLARLGIAAFTMSDVDREGIGAVVRRALRHLGVLPGARSAAAAAAAATPAATLPHLHLSFDIDACDPAIAPGTGTVVPGGLTYREAHYLCEAVASCGALGSLDLAEVNPELEPRGGGGAGGGGGTAALGAGLIASALGTTVLLQDRRGAARRSGGGGGAGGTCTGGSGLLQILHGRY